MLRCLPWVVVSANSKQLHSYIPSATTLSVLYVSTPFFPPHKPLCCHPLSFVLYVSTPFLSSPSPNASTHSDYLLLNGPATTGTVLRRPGTISNSSKSQNTSSSGSVRSDPGSEGICLGKVRAGALCTLSGILRERADQRKSALEYFEYGSQF